MVTQTEATRLAIVFKLFKEAIDQLGSSETVIVLGGINTLHHLACTQSDEFAQPVFEILCGFLREETSKKSRDSKRDNTNNDHNINNDHDNIKVQTIIDKLFREKNGPYKDMNPNLSDVNFSGMFLKDDVNLKRATLWNANLRGSDLSGVDLSGANLSGANLSDADLSGASLEKADLTGLKQENKKTNLNNALLRAARLYDVKFNDETVLTYVDFSGAQSEENALDKIKKRIKEKQTSLETYLETYIDEIKYFKDKKEKSEEDYNKYLAENYIKKDSLPMSDVVNIYKGLIDESS
jgi:uncharacterized protein YjbI with pentapeptide repeats